MRSELCALAQAMKRATEAEPARDRKKSGMKKHAESFNGQHEREKFRMKLRNRSQARRRFDHIPSVRSAHFLCLSAAAADVKTCELMS